ncbi:tRNA 2-thiocytidine(32) synthetase TtcA [Desulfatitalea sp. M08but]|uniref:tRNA 2-thiocytidine(32) synthetase TtcA n=2 Tax=Desulfatitalea alkaliphila TaxID=2929485 RepID=A0AA41UJC0_9BACT|nr:tRNA 2-thiocytidine(32) synthetase TtcA [Desulfatitalea alkaliphila]
MGKALHAYSMIQDGDRIAVGLSGGKDSWALMWLLAERQTRVPVRYSLHPIHIDPGFEGGPSGAIEAFCRRMGWTVHIERTDFGPVAHSDVNRENPCFLCARNRRRRLFEAADRMGCRKLALGHNKDDLIETLFINMFYAGEISTMMAHQPFFDGRITVIRPLAYTDEAHLERFARIMQFPVPPNPCPSAGRSKRAAVKDMLRRLYADNRKIKGNIFRSMRHVRAEYLPR